MTQLVQIASKEDAAQMSTDEDVTAFLEVFLTTPDGTQQYIRVLGTPLKILETPKLWSFFADDIAFAFAKGLRDYAEEKADV